jgi:hypothetical protein
MSKWGSAVKELDDFLKTHTILETLKHANSDAFVCENVNPYFRGSAVRRLIRLRWP